MKQIPANKKIVISGGGTGGHLYPGLAVADAFRNLEWDVLYLGSHKGLEAEVVPKEGYPFAAVASQGIAGKPWRKLAALVKLGIGSVQAWIKLRAFRPDVVVGTGGFVCVPAVVAAKLCGIPIVLLEQNAVPGKATLLLSRFAATVCLSFAETATFFPRQKTEWTGNPLRSSIKAKSKEDACQVLGLDPSRPTLLVAGASQGATSINKALLKALEAWPDKLWNIVHLTGRNHLARVVAKADGILDEKAKIIYQVFGFRQDMENLYSAADLVVTRAGATTIAELSSLGLPAIFVPYPFAGGHQKDNAKVLVECGAARCVADELVEDSFQQLVEELLENKNGLQEMSTQSLLAAKPDAAQAVCRVCRELVK